MASEGTKGEQPPPVQTLVTAVHGSVEAKCELNMDNLSKPELLTLLSIMEGELEARDLVIEALRARRKEVFLQERYGHFSLTDPFLALQRDCESGAGQKEHRPVSSSPISVLEAVMAHCRKMQERMSSQLAAAESRQKRLEMEKLQLQSLEQEHRKLSAQLKDEREKNKHVVMMLVRECKQLAARVVEESQRFEELSLRSEQEGRSLGRMEEELAAERRRSQQMEAEMEKQLAEFDTEREQLRARLSREESRTSELRTESDSLRQQVEQLRTERGKDALPLAPVATPAPAPMLKPKSTVSVAVGTEVNCRAIASQTDLLPEHEVPKKVPLTIPVKPTGANYTGMNLPKTTTTGRGLHHGSSQAENGGEGQVAPNPAHGLHSPGTAATLPTGVSPRVQAARYKFQPSASEQDQNGIANQSPPPRDLSPTNRDNFAAKQQARHTVTQVLSRFTSPPAGGPPATLRPGLSHSTSEGGPFAGRLGHPQIGIKSPTVARIDRGNPPPIPPKKPGLSQTPSPPHPPIKVVGEASRSPGAGLGVGPAKSATTPQLPPKPALDLGGVVPALTASQVGAPKAGRQRGLQPAAACVDCPPVTTTTSSIATIVSSPSVNPTSLPSHSAQHPGSPLAAASGWCPSIDPPLACGDPVPLDDGHTLLLQAASQGNVTLLSMLLNQDPPMDISHLQQDLTSALFSAARNGHTECLNLLLTLGACPNAPDVNGFTPLHIAAIGGHHGCVRALLGHGAEVDCECVGGRTPLFLACEHGSTECVRVLLDAGADRSHITADNCTALHATVSLGHVGALRLLLYHPSPGPGTGDPAGNLSNPDPRRPHTCLPITRHILNHTNQDGWTAAHIAASRGYKKCLEVLCTHGQQDIEKRDKCNRTIHDVATDDCKELLENLDCYRVAVQVHTGSREHLCPVDLLEDGPNIGTVAIQRHTSWTELGQMLSQLLASHLHLVCGSWDLQESVGGVETSLGLSSDSIASVKIGETEWLLGRELAQSPWDLIRKRLSQRVSIFLKGLAECALDQMTYDSLIPLQLLQNYVRLVEQYRNVIFHGLEGSFQEYIANQISHHIKHRKEAVGIGCDIIHVAIEENLSKNQLLETFINCGFLVPAREDAAGQCVIVILEGLERAHSLSHMLDDLCEALENRGLLYSLSLGHAGAEGLYYFQEGSFLIGTLARPRLLGPELRLQQHFRWVQLRWDTEPLSGMLGRHLRRKLLHQTQGENWATDDSMQRALSWVCSVWYQLNGCLSRLGTPEALLGPHIFLSCPVLPQQTHAIVKWLSHLWNMVVVPRVEDAVISRVTAKRAQSQRQSPSNKGLSPGQRAVVRASLSILLNKAMLQGCPLAHSEMDGLLPEFRGGCFPLCSISSSYRKGGRKGRDGGAWRRSNTSPRKKGSSAGIPSSSSAREGSVANSDVHLLSNVSHPRLGDGDSVTLALYSDDESDLIKELQTMCSSKSEPDISKIVLSQEDFIMLPGSILPTPQRTAEQGYTDIQPQAVRVESCVEVAQPPQQQIDSSLSAGSHGSPRCLARPKSQLPVPTSRGQQQTPSSTQRATTSISSSTRSPHAHSSNPSRTHTSSRTRQAPPSNNRINQSEEETWILNSSLHENYSNHK
ncbi:cortactin-binding protein 2 isoform X1 [Electrophorus electricus]|uniref:cortactin-binding protein 2 isoform X1 n=1 Tax=Electrophorus electricus TaxID=8005 RepID=UPI0015D0BA1B|nr:cortactin-binding protein 2 isoform X1 [Electrophorus electricus]